MSKILFLPWVVITSAFVTEWFKSNTSVLYRPRKSTDSMIHKKFPCRLVSVLINKLLCIIIQLLILHICEAICILYKYLIEIYVVSTFIVVWSPYVVAYICLFQYNCWQCIFYFYYKMDCFFSMWMSIFVSMRLVSFGKNRIANLEVNM